MKWDNPAMSLGWSELPLKKVHAISVANMAGVIDIFKDNRKKFRTLQWFKAFKMLSESEG